MIKYIKNPRPKAKHKSAKSHNKIFISPINNIFDFKQNYYLNQPFFICIHINKYLNFCNFML